MLSMLIGKDSQLLMVNMPEKFRGQVYQIIGEVSPLVLTGQWVPVLADVRTFVWRGQVARKNGTTLVDLFEEV